MVVVIFLVGIGDVFIGFLVLWRAFKTVVGIAVEDISLKVKL